MKLLSRLIVSCLLLLPALTRAADRPNVLFLAVDDLRPEFGAYGFDYIRAQTSIVSRAGHV